MIGATVRVRRIARAGGAGRSRLVRDSVLVTVGGQVSRVLGIATSLGLRWGLTPAEFGVYSGLRLYLDQTNRSSLGVGLGASQEITVLRARGQEGEAARLANVAYSFTFLTCLVYSLILVLWAFLKAPILESDPQAQLWTWGLVAVAVLACLQRQSTFRIAILRAHQEFGVTTELDVIESLVTAGALLAGLWLAGFWGLWPAIAVVLGFRLAYLNRRHPLRFSWTWDLATIGRLMRIGLPIFANTALFGFVLTADRVVALWAFPDGSRAAGLYSVALVGTSWATDIAGRVVTVLYTHYQRTLGETGEAAAVVAQAARSTEVLAAVLGAGAAFAYLLLPGLLRFLLPSYEAGLPALRPLLPGAICLGLTWPLRQALIATGQPYRLAAATVPGLLAIAALSWLGASRHGLAGLAAGASVGDAFLLLVTSGVTLITAGGVVFWLRHLAVIVRLAFGGLAIAACVEYLPLGDPGPATLCLQLTVTGLLVSFMLFHWSRCRAEWFVRERS